MIHNRIWCIYNKLFSIKFDILVISCRNLKSLNSQVRKGKIENTKVRKGMNFERKKEVGDRLKVEFRKNKSSVEEDCYLQKIVRSLRSD